jgi:hypothetical protein
LKPFSGQVDELIQRAWTRRQESLQAALQEQNAETALTLASSNTHLTTQSDILSTTIFSSPTRLPLTHGLDFHQSAALLLDDTR